MIIPRKPAPRHYVPWSAAEDAHLREHYRKTPTPEIASAIKRSSGAIVQRANKIGAAKSIPRRPQLSRWVAYATEEALKLGESPDNVLNRKKSRGCWIARWQAFRRLRDEGFSLLGIGRVAGFDHGSVWCGIKRLNELENECADILAVGKSQSVFTRNVTVPLIRAAGMR